MKPREIWVNPESTFAYPEHRKDTVLFREVMPDDEVEKLRDQRAGIGDKMKLDLCPQCEEEFNKGALKIDTCVGCLIYTVYKLKTDLEIATEALDFYSHGSQWSKMGSGAYADIGKIAHEALTKIKGDLK